MNLLSLFFMKSSRLGESGTERIVLGDKEWPLTTLVENSGEDFHSGGQNDTNFH